MFKQTKFESAAYHRLQPYFHRAPEHRNLISWRLETGVHKLLCLAKTDISKPAFPTRFLPSTNFIFRTKNERSKRAAEKKGCYKQLQQQTMTSDKTNNPTYPNHEWVPPSLTTAWRKFASTRRDPHKKMPRRILIAVPIRRGVFDVLPANRNYD